MDLASQDSGDDVRVVVGRGIAFFGWFVGFLAAVAVIGLIPAVMLFVIAYMRIEGRESWRLCTALGVAAPAFIGLVFDQVMSVPWPRPILGSHFPALGAIVPSL